MKNWIQKLRAATLLQFDDNMLREFIPLDGGMQPNVQQKERFNLEERLHSSFVGNPQRKSILLIGSSGIGKTWFGQHLVRRLWDEEVRFIPLWIRLTSIEVPRKELLYQHLNELKKYQIEKGVAKEDCLTDDDIRDFFRHKQPLFLVLDGYDELSLDKREHQYYQENGWNEWGPLVQMLITSRVEALPKIRAPIFAPKVGEPFTEYYLQTFNKTQLEEMVKRYCSLPTLSKEWDASRYLEQFTTLYELREFISKPFLVKVVLDALPLVFAEIASSPDQTHTHPLLKKRLTRSHLYKKFLEQHFVRESDRLMRMGIGKEIEIHNNAHLPEDSEIVPLPQLLERFTSSLARDMFNRHVSTVKWHPAKQPSFVTTLILTSSSQPPTNEGSNPDWLRPYFDKALSPHAEHLRSGSPIISVGFHEYAFLHYSILEFYAAEQLFNGSLQDSWYLTGKNLNKENLQTTPDVLKNLIARTQEEPLLEEKLFEIIEQSKYIPELWRAAANAITILNGAGICFSGRDFKRIRIGGLEDPNDLNSGWGADLSHSVLSETNLSEADLRYVNLTQAHLVNAILTGACLDRVNFGEQSRIEGSRFSFAGNGQSLVTQMGSELKIYSWPSRKLEGEFSVVWNRSTEDWSSSIRGFAFHPTGQQVAVIKHTYWYEKYPNQYEIDLWDVRQQRCISSLFCISEQVDCITYSPDGNRLAARVNSAIYQWNIKTGTCLLKIKPQSGVNCFAYSPDSSWLASGSEYYDTIQQWNAVTGRPLQTYIGHHRGGVNYCVVYHPKGSRLASGGQDGAVREWNVMTGELLQVYRGHDGGVVSIAYNPDGSRLVSVQDHIVREWDTIIGVSLRTYDWNIGWMKDDKVTYSPDGRYLIFTERHGLLGPSLEGIRQYDIATPAPLKTRENLTHSITGIVYSADGTRITSVGGNVIQEWDVISGALLQSYEVGRGVRSITYNQSGRLAAGGSSTIWQWNIKIGNSFQSYRVKNGADYIAYSPDGNRLASAETGDPVVQQLNADTGAVFCLHRGFNEKIYCVAYSPDGKRLVAGGASSNSQSKSIVLREWNPVTGEILRTYKTASVYKDHIDSVNCVSYSYDSQRLASGHTKVAREWNITTGALLRTFEYEESEFGHSIAYSPNDRYLAFGTESIVHIANMDRVNSSKAVFKLKKAHIGSIYALAWSPDSTKLATGGYDHAIRLWRVCDAAGKINPVLLWQTHPSLASQGLRIHQVTGLSDDNYKLLKESASDVPLQGTPANSERLTSEKVLAERNKQIHLPKGELPIGPVGSVSDSYIVTPDDWLISMMRFKDVKPKNVSDLTGHVGGHIWLLLIGLDEKRFTIFQEIHFYLDTDAPTSGSVFKSGRGLISVRHCAPYDLFPELAARKYEAKSWMISRSQAQQLCANVEKDRLANLPYVNTGHTFFGAPGFSCVTFCEKHLKEIGCIVLEEKEKQWYDFFIALPNNYLPTTSPEPTTTASKCPLM